MSQEERQEGKELSTVMMAAHRKLSLTIEVLNEESDGKDAERLRDLADRRTRRFANAGEALSAWAEVHPREILMLLSELETTTDA